MPPNTVAKHNVEVFTESECSLGEGPLWHAARSSLFWVDINTSRLYEKVYPSVGKVVDNSWLLPEMGSALALDGQNNDCIWIITNKHFGRFNLQTAVFDSLIPLQLSDDMRSNDGSVSPNGHFWFGSMQLQPDSNKGSIYSISPSGELTHQLRGVAIPNTFCWSRGTGKLIFSDSFQQKIYRYLVDSGKLCTLNFDNIVDLSGQEATPDGGAIDQHGRLWNAQWDGGQVVCYSESGSPVEAIDFPVMRLTSCCFGGENNQFLFVTSAREGLSKSELEQYPLSGCVFIVKLDIAGAEVSAFSAYSAEK